MHSIPFKASCAGQPSREHTNSLEHILKNTREKADASQRAIAEIVYATKYAASRINWIYCVAGAIDRRSWLQRWLVPSHLYEYPIDFR